ncbi:HDOD domain-containing protein [Methylophaga sp.]|uniref:HDOD domain-containing protein n=1 Tax=Methylophaga sp. TaxID=2024840 RepID=UPI003F6A166F
MKKIKSELDYISSSPSLHKHTLLDSSGNISARLIELDIYQLIESGKHHETLVDFVNFLFQETEKASTLNFISVSATTYEWLASNQLDTRASSWLLDANDLKQAFQNKLLTPGEIRNLSLICGIDELEFALSLIPYYIFVDNSDSEALMTTLTSYGQHAGETSLALLNAKDTDDKLKDYFNLYHFSTNKPYSAEKEKGHFSNLANIAQVIRSNNLAAEEIRNRIASEPGLVIKILKIANSAYYVKNLKITGLLDAIVRMGSKKILNLIYLTMLQELEPASKNLIFESLIKAFMTEALFKKINSGGDSETAFLVGLLSQLHLMLGIPKTDALRELQLNDEITGSILHMDGPYGESLKTIELFLSGDWESHLDEVTLRHCIKAYSNAIDNASELQLS